MKKKNILFILIILIFIVLIFNIVQSIKNGINLMRLNYMIKDIELLDNQISIYYINNGNLPIKNEEIEFEKNSINPNDNEKYYEIDLSKIENLKTNLGNKTEGEKDIYIINEQSHTVYYYNGVEYQDKKIFTKERNYQKIVLENYQ